MHHSIIDGESVELFVDELCALYQGEVLSPNKLQYKDYSEWINNYNTDREREYWLEQFPDIPITELPLDFPRPKEKGFKGSVVYQQIDETLSAKIRRIAQENHATDYMIFASIVTLLISKYSRQEDVVIDRTFKGMCFNGMDCFIMCHS